MKHASTLLLAFVLVLLTGSPASAEGELELSHDGKHWSTELTQPPFDPELLWVPGDRHVAEFRMRSNAPTPADLTLTMLGEDTEHLLESHQFQLKARLADGPWQQFEAFDHGQRLNHVPVGSGAVSTVQVAVRFLPEDGNETQLQRLSFDFQMRLSEAMLDRPATANADQAGVESAMAIGAVSATTPVSVLRAMAVSEIGVELLVAGALFGVGMAWVLALSRRREEDELDALV